MKKFALAKEPAYYFDPKWSPDSKKIVFHDNRLNIYVLDTTTGKLTTVGDKNVYGGFSNENFDVAWSPDSKWIAYPRSMKNHLHAIYLYSVESGQVDAGDKRDGQSRPSRHLIATGKYLFFIASTNAGATSDGLDMTSDLYQVTSNIYAVTLAAARLLRSRRNSRMKSRKREEAGREESRGQEGRREERCEGSGGDEKARRPSLRR